MFTQSAEFYDAIYHFKDYRAEAERLHALIQTHVRRPARTLLDVACGTGQPVSEADGLRYRRGRGSGRSAGIVEAR
jgi:ubiquinone/menaquinone biosynthesis C-methylase UbiE